MIKDYNLRESHDWEMPITIKEENDFKKVCDENEIVYDNPVEGNIRLNYSDLKLIQHNAYQEIKTKEAKLIKKIEVEIRINK